MNNKDSNQKSNFFHEELFHMKQNNMITISQYYEMMVAYSKLQDHRRERDILAKTSHDIVNTQQATVNSSPNVDDVVTLATSPAPARVIVNNQKKEKKVKNEDEIRERNITWSLILGVLMLLIAGLILSTSNWSNMNDVLKVISIASVSIIFLTLSWVTEKVLKIQKTSFAFLILGSCFIPITFIGAGFFELFGEWLSFYGEGKYVLGLIGAICSGAIYIVNAKKYKSRLFTWLSLLTLSCIVALVLAAMQFKLDAFSLGIIVYNALMLTVYHKYKKQIKFEWVVKEIPLFSQINLIVSSLFTLFFFENHLFYSFNIIVIAILYISMMYINQSKHYHFAFTAFLAYGFFQLASYTPLDYIKEIIIASIALIFIGLHFTIKNDDSLKKVFQWTCAVISFLAFMYISIQTFVLGSDNAIISFVSYIILSLNYVYLSYMTKRKLFSYLAIIFTMLSYNQLYEALPVISNFAEEFNFLLISGLLFVLYFKRRPVKWLSQLETPSLIVSVLAYIVIFVSAYTADKWLTVSILGVLASGIFYATSLKEKTILTNIVGMIAPLILIVSSISLFDMIRIEQYDFFLHLSITSVLILLLSRILSKWNIPHTYTFYFAQLLFLLILLSLPYRDETYEPYIVSFILLLSLYMSYAFIKRVGKDATWIIFSILLSLFYFSFIYSLNDIITIHLTIIVLYLLVYPIVFIVLMRVIKERLVNYFYWPMIGFSYIANTVALYYTINSLNNILTELMFIPALVYSYNAIKGNTEVKVKVNLYSALISIPILSSLMIIEYTSFESLITIAVIPSFIMLGIWLIANVNWKRRIDWFIIPYLLISNSCIFIVINEADLVANILVSIAVVSTIYLIHKRQWHFVLLLPLIQFIIFFFLTSEHYLFSYLTMTITSSVIITVMQYISIKVNYHINFKAFFDWYLISSFVFLFIMELYLIDASLFINIVPTVLLTLILLVTRKRVASRIVSNTMITLVLLSLCIIYFKIVMEYYNHIWSPVLLEIIIAPFIVAVILLKDRVWGSSKFITTLEWGVLITGGLLIVFDSIATSSVANTISMGMTGLLGVIVGMGRRIKSYFFIGTGIILVTLYTQTKPLWGSMPWWIYLLVAGVVLISFASIHEWQRQHNNVIKNRLAKIIGHFRGWK